MPNIYHHPSILLAMNCYQVHSRVIDDVDQFWHYKQNANSDTSPPPAGDTNKKRVNSQFKIQSCGPLINEPLK